MPKDKNKALKERKELRIENFKGMRQPRPVGVTYRALAYNQEPNQEEKQRKKERLQQYIIDQYVNNGMELCGKTVTIEQLSDIIDLTTERLLIRLNRTIGRISKLLESGEGAQIARVMILGTLKKSLEFRAQTEAQTHMLLAAQGGQYVPFLTSEANKSLKNLVDSNKPIYDMLKMITEKSPTPILGSSTGESKGNEGRALDTDQAIQLINKHTQSLLLNPDALEAHYLEFEGVPEVRAQFQDLSSIGIKNTPAMIPEKPDHADRARQGRQPNEVLEADDFKA